MLKKFTGFKGLCAFAQIGNVQFVLLAQNKRDLESLWNHIMTEAGPLDPAGCKKAILVEAPLLTVAQASKPAVSQVSKPAATTNNNAPIDV